MGQLCYLHGSALRRHDVGEVHRNVSIFLTWFFIFRRILLKLTMLKHWSGLPRFWNTQKQGFNMAFYRETDGLWALNKDCYFGGGGWLISHNFQKTPFPSTRYGLRTPRNLTNPLALSPSDQEPVSEGRPSTEAPPSFNDLRHMRPLIIHLGSSGCGCGWMGVCRRVKNSLQIVEDVFVKGFWETQHDAISRKLGAKKLPGIIQNHKWKEK